MFSCRRATRGDATAIAPKASICARVRPSPARWIHDVTKGEPAPQISQLIRLCQNLRDGAKPKKTGAIRQALGRLLASSKIDQSEHTPLAQLYDELNGKTIKEDNLPQCIIALQNIQARASGVIPGVLYKLAHEMDDTPNRALRKAIAFLEPFEGKASSEAISTELKEWDAPALSLLLFNKRRPNDIENARCEEVRPSLNAVLKGNVNAVAPFLKILQEKRYEQLGLIARLEYKMQATVRQAQLKVETTLRELKGEAEPIPAAVLDLFDAIEAFEDGICSDERKEVLALRSLPELRTILLGHDSEDREWNPIDHCFQEIIEHNNALIDPALPKKCLALMTSALEKHRGAVAKVVLNTRAMGKRLMRRAPMPLRLLFVELGSIVLKKETRLADRQRVGQMIKQMLPLLPGYLGREVTRKEQGSLRCCSDMLLKSDHPIVVEQIRETRNLLGESIERIQAGSLFTTFDTIREEMVGPDGELHRTIHRITEGMVNDLVRGAPPKLIELHLCVQSMIKDLQANRFDMPRIKKRSALFGEVLATAETLIEPDQLRNFRNTLGHLAGTLDDMIPDDESKDIREELAGVREDVLKRFVEFEAYLTEMVMSRQGAIAKVVQSLGNNVLHLVGKVTGMGEVLPTELPPMRISYHEQNPLLRMLVDRPFQMSKKPVIKALMAIPNHVDAKDRARVRSACNEVKETLQSMETFSFAKLYALFQKLSSLHPVVDGIFELTPTAKGTVATEAAKELMQIARDLQIKESTIKASATFKKWIADHRELAKVFIGEDDRSLSNEGLIREIGKALDSLYRVINESGYVEQAAQQLETTLYLAPGFSRSGPDELTLRVRRHNASHINGTDASMHSHSERHARAKEDFLETFPLFITHLFARWLVPDLMLPFEKISTTEHKREITPLSDDPVISTIQKSWGNFVNLFGKIDSSTLNQLDLIERSAKNSFRGKIVVYTTQLTYRISRWIITSHIVPTIVSMTTRFAENLVQDSTFILGHGQAWATNYTKATEDAQNEKKVTGGFLKTRAQLLSKRQERPRILRKLKIAVSELIVPRVDLADTFKTSEDAIVKWIENSNIQHDVVDLIFATAARAILSVLRTIMIGFSSIAHRCFVWGTRAVMLATNVVENRVARIIADAIANSSDIDKIMLAVSEKLHHIELMRKESPQKKNESHSETSVHAQAKSEMEGFIRSFLGLLNAARVTHYEQSFDSESLNFLKSPLFLAFKEGARVARIPLPEEETIGHLRDLVVEYGATIITDIWSISGNDPTATAQMLQELLFTSIQSFTKRTTQTPQLSYPGAKHPKVEGYESTVQAALQTFLDHAIHRVHGSLGKSERELLDTYIQWLQGELIPAEGIAYSLPQDIITRVDKASENSTINTDLQMLEEIENVLLAFETEYDRGFQPLAASGLGGLAKSELQRIRSILVASLSAIHRQIYAFQAHLSARVEESKNLYTKRIEDEWISQFQSFLACSEDLETHGRATLRNIERYQKQTQSLLVFEDYCYVPSRGALNYKKAIFRLLSCQIEIVNTKRDVEKAKELQNRLSEETLSAIVSKDGSDKSSLLSLIDEFNFPSLKVAFSRNLESGSDSTNLTRLLAEFVKETEAKFAMACENYENSKTALDEARKLGSSLNTKAQELQTKHKDIRDGVSHLVEVAKEQIKAVSRVRIDILDSIGVMDRLRDTSATSLQWLASKVITILQGDNAIATSAGYAAIDAVSTRIIR